MPEGEELRTRKQADFDAFGRTLDIESHVLITDGLLEAARAFRPYSVLPADVARAVAVADDIVDGGVGTPSDTGSSADAAYQLLSPEWLAGTFEACNERMGSWLTTWLALEGDGARACSTDVRAAAGFPPPTPDTPDWMSF